MMIDNKKTNLLFITRLNYNECWNFITILYWIIWTCYLGIVKYIVHFYNDALIKLIPKKSRQHCIKEMVSHIDKRILLDFEMAEKMSMSNVNTTIITILLFTLNYVNNVFEGKKKTIIQVVKKGCYLMSWRCRWLCKW